MIGSARLVSLKKAKEPALELRAEIQQGIDPLAWRRRKQCAASFDEMAAAARAPAKWETNLRAYASPIIGSKPVGCITANDIADCLRPMWLEKAETAGRARGFPFEGKNPASREILRHMLPQGKRQVKHHAALAINDIPALRPNSQRATM